MDRFTKTKTKMKTSSITLNFLIAMLCICCSPRVYELADGRMVSEKKFLRINDRCERRLSNPAYVERLIRSLHEQAGRDQKMTPAEKALFSAIGRTEVEYDTAGVD